MFDYGVEHSNAEIICQSNVGTLISIHSAEENEFAMDLAKREKTNDYSVWIGVKRNNSLHIFEWTNGQEFDYSNFGKGQPESSADPESQVAMFTDGTWGTWNKNVKALFMCESRSSDK